MSLKSRLTVRGIVVMPLVAGLIFGPAGSFGFWQGWVLVGIFAGFNTILAAYFYRRDPKLIERRLRGHEQRREQRQIQMLWHPLSIFALALPGFDYRFGWSAHRLGGVPLLVTGIAFAALVAAWLLVFDVMRNNSFASTTVQVEAGQKVITDGPYRLVRHPMYSGFALMILATPVALGSYVAVPPSLLLILLFVFRLRDEERLLREDLPGYAEYCKRTRYRLLPYVF